MTKDYLKLFEKWQLIEAKIKKLQPEILSYELSKSRMALIHTALAEIDNVLWQLNPPKVELPPKAPRRRWA